MLGAAQPFPGTGRSIVCFVTAELDHHKGVHLKELVETHICVRFSHLIMTKYFFFSVLTTLGLLGHLCFSPWPSLQAISLFFEKKREFFMCFSGRGCH